MCFKNYTQFPGCGHYAETYHNHYTPCMTAFAILSSSRGPSSPPLNPPAEFFPSPSSTDTNNPTTLKRSSTTSKSRRFLSMNIMLNRSNTTSSNGNRKSVSGAEPNTSRTSTSSNNNDGQANDFNIADHELVAVASACPELKNRTLVSRGSGGQVCRECTRWLESMRSMLEGYDKGRGIRGTPAFQEFLEDTVKAKETAHMLGFGPGGVVGRTGMNGGTKGGELGWR